MPDHAPEIASTFRPLRRALIARRLRRLDPVLRLELAVSGALAGGYAAWRARLPLDQLAAAAERQPSGRLLARLDLASRAEEPVAGLPHGMRKKISFAAAVLHRPAVLLLDEALEGFDPAVTLHLGHVVRTLARAEWGGPEHGPSPLEREFLSATQGLHAPEAPA